MNRKKYAKWLLGLYAVTGSAVGLTIFNELEGQDYVLNLFRSSGTQTSEQVNTPPANRKNDSQPQKKANHPPVLEDHVRNPTNYERLLDKISRKARDVRPEDMIGYLESSFEKVIEQWYGTKWNFFGNAKTPQEGEISCGYFTIRTREGLGYVFDKDKLHHETVDEKGNKKDIWLSAQDMVKAATTEKNVTVISMYNFLGLKKYLKEKGSTGIDKYLAANYLPEVGQYLKEKKFSSLQEYLKTNKLEQIEEYVHQRTFNKLKHYLNGRQERYFILGLEKHAAFLEKRGKNIFMIHSSEELGWVVKQKAEDVQSFLNSSEYWIAPAFTPDITDRFFQKEKKPVVP